MKELIGHSVAYRKLVSPRPNELIPEDRIRLFAVAARFPQRLSTQVQWRTVRDGVYDCDWGTDRIRVIVTGNLTTDDRNAVLLLFSPSPELMEFGQARYRKRSRTTSRLLEQLIGNWQNEGIAMPYTMQDFERDYIKEKLPNLPEDERRDVLADLPLEALLAGRSPEELKRYLENLTSNKAKKSSKPRRKKLR